MSRAPKVIVGVATRGSERSVAIRWWPDGDHPEVTVMINIRRLSDGTPVISIPRIAGHRGVRVLMDNALVDPRYPSLSEDAPVEDTPIEAARAEESP